jgi:hypothetical protein
MRDFPIQGSPVLINCVVEHGEEVTMVWIKPSVFTMLSVNLLKGKNSRKIVSKLGTEILGQLFVLRFVAPEWDIKETQQMNYGVWNEGSLVLNAAPESMIPLDVNLWDKVSDKFRATVVEFSREKIQFGGSTFPQTITTNDQISHLIGVQDPKGSILDEDRQFLLQGTDVKAIYERNCEYKAWELSTTRGVPVSCLKNVSRLFQGLTQ